MLNWANMVTGIRVLLILVVAGLLYTSSFSYRLAALILVIIVIFMDSLDGYIARKYNFTTTAGTLIDITGDRIVELVLWIVLAERGIVHVVVPIIFLVRGIITDMIRAVKLKQGKTAFGKDTMMSSKIGRNLVASRFSRGLYGVSKGVIFGYLILIFALQKTTLALPFTILNHVGLGLVIYLIIYNLVRGIPVIYEGRDIFKI